MRKTTLLIAAMVGGLAFGCATDPASEDLGGAGGKADSLNDSCQPDELAALGECDEKKCGIVDAADHATCVVTNCAAELGALSTTCSECVTETPLAEISEVCTPQPTFACEEGELTPLGVCSATNCSNADPADMQTCVITNCGAIFAQLSETCTTCLTENAGATSAEVGAACSPPPPFACKADALTPLGICKATNCATADPADLQTCVFTNCSAELQALTPSCTECLTDNAGTPSAEVADICQAPESTLVCEAGEVAPLALCAAEACEDFSADQQAPCLFVNCQNQILGMSRTCLGCVDLDRDISENVTECEVGE